VGSPCEKVQALCRECSTAFPKSCRSKDFRQNAFLENFRS
jgi:hypothetical protein